MQPLSIFSTRASTAQAQKKTLITRVGRTLPGVIAGAADLDPAAVLTATVAGASFSYSLGWVVVLCVPVLFSVFAVSSRIGHQTGKGLIQLIREHHGRKTAITIALLVVAVNLAMIVGDIVAVSESFSLITALPRLYFLALVGFIVWYILIIGNYHKTTKALGTLTLILIAYVVAAFHLTESFAGLARGILLPKMQLNTGYMMGVVAVFGSLLTPDVIVWQTSSRRGLPEGVARAHVSESHAGTFVACMVSLCAMIAASHIHVADPSIMSTRTASQALDTFGYLGPILFSVGIAGSGLIALPILVASLCFSVAEAFGWKSGLAFVPWDARLFYVMISVTVFLSLFIDMFGINTVQVLYWSQVLAGIVLVPIFGYILLISNNPKVMRTVNSRSENLWLSFAATSMLISNLLFFWTEFL
ncbi:MAG TPA: divalent metal cation transporter [Candidatus Angelobacter sp.]|nr:divalent metal cation transporter [Candidatus Angelobacter sp.]